MDEVAVRAMSVAVSRADSVVADVPGRDLRGSSW